jgi:hypothetical protein
VPAQENQEARATVPEADRGRIATALEDGRWKFRTAEGIARQIGSPVNRVRRVLQSSSELARESVMTDAAGRPLYAPWGRRLMLRERLERIRFILSR